MKLPEGVDPVDQTFDLEFGARYYKSDESKSTETDCGYETYVPWYQPTVEYDAEMQVAPTYDEAAQVAADSTLEEITNDAKTIFADRISAIVAEAEAEAAAAPAGEEKIAAMEMRSKQEAVEPVPELQATQTYSQGYTQYEKLTESDWWWWWISLDVPDRLLKDGDILFQYVTITEDGKDKAGATIKKSETIGCYVVVGANSATSNVDVFTHPTGENWSLKDKNADAGDNPGVVGKKWNEQQPKLKQFDADETWLAGSTQIATSAQATPSTIEDNSKYTCYFYEELKKIGRNPADFGINIDIQVSARVYEGDEATTFIQMPVTSATVKKKALAAYVAPEAEKEEPVVEKEEPVVDDPPVVVPGEDPPVVDPTIVDPPTNDPIENNSGGDSSGGDSSSDGTAPGADSAFSFMTLVSFIALFVTMM